jgi:hypothetical protein
MLCTARNTRKVHLYDDTHISYLFISHEISTAKGDLILMGMHDRATPWTAEWNARTSPIPIATQSLYDIFF